MASAAQHRLRDWLLSLYQYLLPQHTLSRLMYRLTRHRIAWLTGLQIRLFARIFGVNLEEAESSSPKDYPNFNAFFTRALGEGTRPIAGPADAVVSPVDGRISQLGPLTGNRLIQAKGWSYSLVDLLGGSETRAAPFQDGQFATLYLSPKDYHRIHMPLSGCLREMVYLPGRLFSVSPKTVNGIPNLFARNERVVSIFETEAGPLAMVLVGAIFVGSIETVWAGQITPPYRHQPCHWLYEGEKALPLEKGQEMGRFNMGSTVILILPPGVIHWQSSLQPESRILMGQTLGQLTTTVQVDAERQRASA
ncbi:phosphatidylserine decarboxylase [Nitrosococcus halophilus Nc 4]|uniref:Phosphatidylserine decarboxylase proenzyme n=1 Tax=Nitrosococcus halophilus (strain Nc4) TaxID=472759 RepID=D5BVJ8_NITHN|nr:archaetidylserine decarboxylase [Nitrosococcus halophilus]ADE13626.1 phosphatidylserine decarboxylase [Nitrosococcus halophilus Nc 4]